MKFVVFFLLPVALFSQEAAVPQQSIWPTIMMVAVALVFFYFILWRPEQKRRKTMEKMRSDVKVGDRVTAMGIVGRVSKLPEGATIILDMVDGAKIEVLKAAISEVHPAK